MNQTIGYSKSELDDTFAVILHRIQDIDDRVRLMEEQGAGLRTNLDWASTARGMALDVNDLKNLLNRFGIVDVPYDHRMTSYNYKESHLAKVIEEFKRGWIKQQAHPDDDLY